MNQVAKEESGKRIGGMARGPAQGPDDNHHG